MEAHPVKARVQRGIVALKPVVRIRLNRRRALVAEQEEGVFHKAEGIGKGIVPGDVNMIVFAIDFHLIPLVVHVVGLHDLTVNAHLRQQIGIALGIAVASALSVYHQIVGLARQQIAGMQHQLIMQHQRLIKLGHVIVHLVKVPLRPPAELRAHGGHLIVGIQRFHRITAAVGKQITVLVIFHPAPVQLQRVHHLGAVLRIIGVTVTIAHKEQLRVRVL